MEIQAERIDGMLILSLDGRLDAFGAAQLDEALKNAIVPEDSTVVLDMANVSYLSSGGIRTLLATEKVLKPRGGGIQLCGVQSYPLKVLAMAGFDQLFAIWPTREAALKHARALLSRREAEVQWDRLPTFTSRGARFTVLEAAHNEAVLKVTSDIAKVLYAQLGDADICTRRFSETEYSIGLGALGESVSACAPLLGEMITIGGTMVWLPTDGHDTPDFLIPQRDTGEVTIFTGFNVALDGPFNDLIVLECEGEKTGLTIGDLYAAIFEFARERRPAFKGLLSLALWADLDAAYSSGVKISPIKKFAPANREMILHRDNIAQWFDVSTAPKHRGETMVSFGIGLDLLCDRSSLDHDAINALFYLHPENVGSKQMLLHNHGVIFKHVPWERTQALDEAIKRIVREVEFIDMRHLLDTTSISRAVIGVSYIAAVVFEEPTRISIAGSCLGWTEPYEHITRKLHQNCSDVLLTPITSGYSGSLVFRVHAWDRASRKEMPFVLKLGRWANIHDEIRGYEEHVKRYIQNNATQLIEHCKLDEYGGILYNFVGITGTASQISSLEEYYRAHSTDEVLDAFDKLFRVVLRAWYGQPKLTELALYEEYGKWYNYEAIRTYAHAHFGVTPDQELLELPFGLGKAVNPLYFAEKVMPARRSKSVSVYQASVHGDLNMKNVLMDEEANMWLIDFSETQHAHILRDIAKLEAVLKFERIELTSEEQLRAVLDLERRFLDAKSLSEIPQLPDTTGDPEVHKAFRCVRKLREYANVITLLDEDISQYWLSLLFSTMIVLAYGSVNDYGKRYAWISSALLSQKLL